MRLLRELVFVALYGAAWVWLLWQLIRALPL